MKLIISETYDTLSSRAAEDTIHCMNASTDPLLCPASGSSPIGLYDELIKHSLERSSTVPRWKYAALDEWVGMNGSDEGSCRQSLDQYLFHPLKTEPEKICFFDGRSKDLLGECVKVEKFIKDHKGIDVVILGLGMNGHVGLNEPGTLITSRAHITDIDALTQKVGQKYFKEEKHLSKGITLGIANLLEAKHIFLLVNGKKKADVVKKLVDGPITEKLPASLLMNHADFRVYLDKEAASQISYS